MAAKKDGADAGARGSGTSGFAAWRPLLFFVYALLILGMGWAYALWQIRSDRAITLKASNDELLMTATALGAQVEAMLNDGMGAAAAAANVVRARGGLAVPTDEQRTILGQMTTGGSYVHALFIAAGGKLVLAPAGNHPVPGDDEVQGWLQALQARTNETWVGPPTAREGDHEVQVALARRVADIGGQTAWAGALIGWETVDRNYARLAADGSTVAIVAEDGHVIARLPITPDRSYVGLSVNQYEVTRRFRAMPVQPLVSLTAPDTLTGVPRQFAIRRLEGLPILAVAGRNVADSLRAWSVRRRASLETTSVASLAILVLTFALYRLLTRRFTALLRSEERFELAVAGTNDGVWEWDGDTGRLFLAPRLLELIHRSERDPAFARLPALRPLVHPEDLNHAEVALRAHLQRREPLDVELRLRVVDDWRWFRARGQAIWNPAGKPTRMAGAIGDIHDSKLAAHAVEVARRAEFDAKQEFARQLILAQEQERKRLANDLHDSVGQNLSLIRNRSVLLQKMELPAAAQRQAEALHGLATDAIEEVRSVAQNLRPLHIEEMGVTDAIEALVERVQHSSPLHVICKIENIDDVLQGSAATHVFRIVQESVNNVLKHAEATNLLVTITRDIAHVRLVISDDGRGFDRASSPRRGLGLLSIEERGGILGGTLQIESTPGGGTRLCIDIPVMETEE